MRRLWRAMVEFEMIAPGDRILVGFSGGKDSAFLLYALNVIRQHGPIPFDLGAVTIDLGFEMPLDVGPIEAYCRRLSVPFLFDATRIGEAALSNENKENPCALCSHLRRGAINNLARAHGYNKVALAHHHDDAVETFLMSIFYSGQIQTFMPKIYLTRSGITTIRPLVYFREYEIKKAAGLTGFDPIPNPCPVSERNKRKEIKALIREMARQDRTIYRKLAAAIRRDAVKELWPPLPTRSELAEKHRMIFHRK
ncbi:MAG TPA: tRNA 2-thiocytidine biosynthesis protein TtcA [Firmicutes bacterium]|nr:tRNA 2-thiocytidine biosynthesis protein TtcA [Bacillota bacterium]